MGFSLPHPSKAHFQGASSHQGRVWMGLVVCWLLVFSWPSKGPRFTHCTSTRKAPAPCEPLQIQKKGKDLPGEKGSEVWEEIKAQFHRKADLVPLLSGQLLLCFKAQLHFIPQTGKWTEVISPCFLFQFFISISPFLVPQRFAPLSERLYWLVEGCNLFLYQSQWPPSWFSVTLSSPGSHLSQLLFPELWQSSLCFHTSFPWTNIIYLSPCLIDRPSFGVWSAQWLHHHIPDHLPLFPSSLGCSITLWCLGKGNIFC